MSKEENNQTKIELPLFDANEINELRKRAMEGLNESRRAYYRNCVNIVERHDSGEITIYTDKMARWLWGIKTDLKERGRR